MEQPIDKLAQKVADQFEERKNEDIDAWAERLAEEVSKYSDADEEWIWTLTGKNTITLLREKARLRSLSPTAKNI